MLDLIIKLPSDSDPCEVAPRKILIRHFYFTPVTPEVLARRAQHLEASASPVTKPNNSKSVNVTKLSLFCLLCFSTAHCQPKSDNVGEVSSKCNATRIQTSSIKVRLLLATAVETRSEKQWWWQHSLDFGFGVFFSELSYPDLLRFHFWSQFVSLWTRTWFSKECPLSGIDRDDHWPVHHHHHHHHHHGCCRCIQIVLLALVLVIIIYVIFYI